VQECLKGKGELLLVCERLRTMTVASWIIMRILHAVSVDVSFVDVSFVLSRHRHTFADPIAPGYIKAEYQKIAVSPASKAAGISHGFKVEITLQHP
jgi:hypothetical protein